MRSAFVMDASCLCQPSIPFLKKYCVDMEVSVDQCMLVVGNAESLLDPFTPDALAWKCVPLCFIQSLRCLSPTPPSVSKSQRCSPRLSSLSVPPLSSHRVLVAARAWLSTVNDVVGVHQYHEPTPYSHHYLS